MVYNQSILTDRYGVTMDYQERYLSIYLLRTKAPKVSVIIEPVELRTLRGKFMITRQVDNI